MESMGLQGQPGTRKGEKELGKSSSRKNNSGRGNSKGKDLKPGMVVHNYR